MLALAQIRSNPVKLTVLLLLLLLAPLSARAQCMFTNGTFETGDLTGWTVYNRTIGTANWYNYTGTTTPLSIHAISAPPQGTRAAVSDHTDRTSQALYQDFTLPAGQSGTLTFYLAYNNTQPFFVALDTLDYNGNQQARIDLIKTTAADESIAATDVYTKLFQTRPGDPLVMAPTLMTYDVSGFAGITARLRFAVSVGIGWLPFAVDNVCLSTTRTTITRPTAVASNVTTNFGDVSLLFPSVTVAGTSSLQQLDPAAQTGPPAGLAFIGPAYDISTTATYTNPVHVCFTLPSITNATTFSHLRMLHKEGGVWVNLASSTVNFNSKQLCGNVTSLSPFAIGQGSGPTAAPAQISGQVTTSTGEPLGGVAMQLSGSQNRRTITNASGFYSFDVEPGGFYTITATRGNYSFAPGERSLSPIGNVTDAAFTATADAEQSVNPLDEDLFFVRQQYLDFLAREPDSGGLAYWDDQLVRCGADENCLHQQRIGVSAAFFVESEFQRTGSFIYRLYSSALGRRLSYTEFSADRQQVVGGANLDAARAAFADRFVERDEFQQRYLASTTAESFVDALLATVSSSTGVDLSAQRGALIDKYRTGANLNESRSLVLREAIEQDDFKQAVYNPSFVAMQYFGYLRRNPDEGGYRFWLNVLDQEPGNFRGMVCSFLTSAEYQRRFASVVTHGNGECGQ
jgi:hypothetical protein